MQINLFNSITALIGGIIGFLYGENMNMMLQILIALVIIDFVLGFLSAAFRGVLSSFQGGKGIIKKVVIFLIVAVANLLDQALGQNIIMNATIFFYLHNEVVSIIENAGKMGLPIPNKIKDTIKVLKNKTDDDIK